MKRKIPDYSSRHRRENSGKRESCFWQKKIGHENGQGENTGERGQLLDERHRGSGRDGHKHRRKEANLEVLFLWNREDSRKGGREPKINQDNEAHASS